MLKSSGFLDIEPGLLVCKHLPLQASVFSHCVWELVENGLLVSTGEGNHLPSLSCPLAYPLQKRVWRPGLLSGCFCSSRMCSAGSRHLPSEWAKHVGLFGRQPSGITESSQHPPSPTPGIHE